jgi:RNA polymerase sigma-70 factor (sigma-E family)
LSGDPSFEEYAAIAWPRLVRAAVLMGADSHTAEDIAQAALTKCFLAWKRVSRADDIDAYVHRILFRIAKDRWRRKSSHEVPVAHLRSSPMSTPDVADDVVKETRMTTALDSLPLGQRQVIVLRFFLGMTEAQAAAVLRVPIGTIKSRGARALAALSEHPDIIEDRRGVNG